MTSLPRYCTLADYTKSSYLNSHGTHTPTTGGRYGKKNKTHSSLPWPCMLKGGMEPSTEIMMIPFQGVSSYNILLRRKNARAKPSSLSGVTALWPFWLLLNLDRLLTDPLSISSPNPTLLGSEPSAPTFPRIVC